MSTKQSALDVILAAQAATRAAAAANQSLRDLLDQAMQSRLPVGTVIDLRQRSELKTHLISVSTRRGNDRGTRIFRIESAPTVDLNPNFPGLSGWNCRATPISEKTGKDMLASAPGAGLRDTVQLCGAIFHFRNDEVSSPEQAESIEVQQMADFIDGVAAKNEPQAPARRTRP